MLYCEGYALSGVLKGSLDASSQWQKPWKSQSQCALLEISQCENFSLMWCDCRAVWDPGGVASPQQVQGTKPVETQTMLRFTVPTNAEKLLSYLINLFFQSHFIFSTPTFRHPSPSKASPIFPLKNKANSVPIFALLIRYFLQNWNRAICI